MIFRILVALLFVFGTPALAAQSPTSGIFEHSDSGTLVAKKKKKKKKKKMSKKKRAAKKAAALKAKKEAAADEAKKKVAEEAAADEAKKKAAEEAAAAEKKAEPEPVTEEKVGNIEVINASSAADAAVTSSAESESEKSENVPADIPEVEAEAETTDVGMGVVVGLKLGGALPQIYSDLGTSSLYTLEAGYLLPFLGRHLEAFADGTYVQSSLRSSGTDERLDAGEVFDYTLIERQLLVHAGARYRVMAPGTKLNYYGGGALRLDMQRSEVHGDVETLGIGKNTETKTTVGVVIMGGAEFEIGPGAIVGEVSLAFADLSHRVTGDVATGGLGLGLGYRLFF